MNKRNPPALKTGQRRSASESRRIRLKAPPPAERGTRGRILIVDDDADLLEVNRTVLKEAGFDVAGASSGAKCLEFLRSESPDLILLDVNLPDINGIALCRQLRSNPATAGISIVQLSGEHTSSEEQAAGLDSGADGYIARPLTNRELVARIDAVLRLKRAEADLREKARELHSASYMLGQIMRRSLDFICVLDERGGFMEVSAAAERILGYSRDGSSGRCCIDFTHPEDRAKTISELVAVTGGRDAQDFENRCLHKNGSVVHLTWSANWSPSDRCMFCVGRDVTERKRLDAQLLSAQRMETIGTLADGIAHDLNNVLAPILMSIDLLRLFAEDPASREVLDTIEISAQRGAEMVRQILTFARASDGERLIVDTERLITELQAFVVETFPKRIRLETDLKPGIRNVLGDPTQVRQALLNICLNAREAIGDEGRIRISAENVTFDELFAAAAKQGRPGDYVVIRVEDTGPGIPPELLDKIFDPFFTTKNAAKGAGLGLSTARSIVSSHGGFITASSEPGTGAAFSVYLPASVNAPVAPGKAKPGRTAMPKGNGESILVVDDEESIRAIMRQTLEAFGYRCISAANGVEAVGIYAREREAISAVITDIMMPQMDGQTLIQVLSRINPLVKIIASSSLNAGKAGAKYFLRKPFTTEALLRTLSRALNE